MQTIGERLEEARKKKGISIREAAEATKIRGDYLQKFESNQFDIGLTEIYTRGFLRTYANFLKIPADRLLNDYAALGRGEVRPRQPSREIYGRMDISVAHADNAERAAAAAESAPPEPSPANRGPGRPRVGASLPTGPDPALVFKYVKLGGIGVGALVLLILVISWWPSKRGASGGSDTTSRVAPSGPTIGLIALKQVKVTVRKKNADGTRGEFVFSSVIPAGDQKTVPWTGGFFIIAQPPEGLDVELDSKRYNFAKVMSETGEAEIMPPKLQ